MNIKPDWETIATKLHTNATEEESNKFWTEECSKWLEAIKNHFNGDYKIIETKNFFLLSDETDKYNKVFSEFLEATLKRILFTLKDLASDEGYGKHVAIVFTDNDQYYDYISLFYPEEGTFGLSSGTHINEGYGHFVFPTQNLEFAEPIATHELTHACLNHLPIPLWLNEGIAVSMEETLSNIPLHLDNEVFAKHQSYWTTDTIQKFWTGDSFFAPDQSQELSYNLAHVLVKNISVNYEVFAEFAKNAFFEDAGEQASQDYLGCSLSEVVQTFLGEGNWGPDLLSTN